MHLHEEDCVTVFILCVCVFQDQAVAHSSFAKCCNVKVIYFQLLQ